MKSNNKSKKTNASNKKWKFAFIWETIMLSPTGTIVYLSAMESFIVLIFSKLSSRGSRA